MFIDTSAFVAIFCDEPEAARFARQIERAGQSYTSPVVRLETCMVLARRLDRSPIDIEIKLDSFLAQARTQIIDITDEIGREAVAAFARYGKGRRNKAKLNLADCVSYACARAHNIPILFKGRDFGHTDLASAV